MKQSSRCSFAHPLYRRFSGGQFLNSSNHSPSPSPQWGEGLGEWGNKKARDVRLLVADGRARARGASLRDEASQRGGAYS